MAARLLADRPAYWLRPRASPSLVLDRPGHAVIRSRALMSSSPRRRRGRLSRSGDFDRVYREGRSHGNRFVVLYAFPREEDDSEATRLGISVGRKVGGAVDRNRVKRALREGFWEIAERLPDRYDFVLVARPDLAERVEREGTGGARGAIEDVLAEGRLTRGDS